MIKAVKVTPVFKQATQLLAILQQLDQFRSERVRLEQILDAKVETAEELSLAKYVSSANEEVVKFPQRNSAAFNGEVVREADEAQRLLRSIRMKAETAIKVGGFVFVFFVKFVKYLTTLETLLAQSYIKITHSGLT